MRLMGVDGVPLRAPELPEGLSGATDSVNNGRNDLALKEDRAWEGGGVGSGWPSSPRRLPRPPTLLFLQEAS